MELKPSKKAPKDANSDEKRYSLGLNPQEAKVLVAAASEKTANRIVDGLEPLDIDIRFMRKLRKTGDTFESPKTTIRHSIIDTLNNFSSSTPAEVDRLRSIYPTYASDKFLERFEFGKKAGEMAMELTSLLEIEEIVETDRN